jgi:lysyl oxidase
MAAFRICWTALLVTALAACDDEDAQLVDDRGPVSASTAGAAGAPATGGTAGTSGAASAGADAGCEGASCVPSQPTGPLPDLVLDEAYLIDTTVLDSISVDDMCLMNEGCVTGLGERRVVRFGSRAGNVGDADFRLGTPAANNPLWTYDACHEGFELDAFARYELREAATGQIVGTGVKNGFCIGDNEEWIAESGVACGAYACGREQGISPGCADNYGSALKCQWIDVTDIPPGAYELRVTINATRSVPELDYENNVVIVSLTLGEQDLTVER